MFGFSRRHDDDDGDYSNNDNGIEADETKQPTIKSGPKKDAEDRPVKPKTFVKDPTTKQLKVNPELLGAPPSPRRVPKPPDTRCCVIRFICGEKRVYFIDVPTEYLAGSMVAEWQEAFLNRIDEAAGHLEYPSAMYQLQWWTGDGSRVARVCGIDQIYKNSVDWQSFCNSVLKDQEHRIFI